jgi:hypothetical protein
MYSLVLDGQRIELQRHTAVYCKPCCSKRQNIKSSFACAQVFGPHVTRWINGSKSGLCARCRQIEATTMASALHPDRITEEGAQHTNSECCALSLLMSEISPCSGPH